MRVRASLLACALLVAWVFVPVTARADETNPSVPSAPSAPDPNAIVPPRLLSSPEMTYPDGAHGDAVVTLGVTVSKDGSVRDVRILQGEEPFASLAREAARAYRFEPARRGDVPISAIIRFEATFTEPVVQQAEEPEEEPAAPAPGGKPPEPPPDEVKVVGVKRKPPMVSTMGRAEVRQLPGAFGDPFRAIEVMPGVTPIVSGLPYYYIRGAPPGNVGYLLDGIEVPYLFHFAAGPSVIHPGMVSEVNLYRAAYPAHFGRYAGGVVSAETVAPHDTFFGEANIRLFDAGALVEAPFGKDNRWHALAGGRFSYTAALLSLAAPGVSIGYRDYQARVTYDLSPRERISVFSFGAYDLASGEDKGEEVVFFASEFYRTDIRYDRDLENGGTLRAGTAFGYDRTRLEGSQFARAYSVQPRVTTEMPLSKRVRARFGGDTLVKKYDADRGNPFAGDESDDDFRNSFLGPRTDVRSGLWTDVNFELAPGVDVTPGLRFDFYESKGDRALGVDPRVSGRARLTRKLRAISAAAIAHQNPAFVVPVPALAVAGLPGGLQKTAQTSAGIEADLPASMEGSLTFFHNRFVGVSDALGGSTGGDSNDLLARTNGKAYGAELSVKRRLTERVGGLVAYTLSRSERDTGLGASPALFDRTHVFNAVLSFDLGKKWRFGGRTVFYTGRPNANEITAPTPEEAAERTRRPPRTPAFFRLDVRLEKRWDLKKGWISFVAEVMNTTLSREVLEVSCATPGRCEPQKFGPVTIPSLGLEGGLP